MSISHEMPPWFTLNGRTTITAVTTANPTPMSIGFQHLRPRMSAITIAARPRKPSISACGFTSTASM